MLCCHLEMILAPTITTRRKKKELIQDKMADAGKLGEEAATPPSSNDETEKDITLKDLYKLTLSVKKGLTKEIKMQKKVIKELEDENYKLSNEVKVQGKLIQQLTTRVQACEARAKFHQLTSSR